MSELEVSVKFSPQGKIIYVLKGTKILEAAGRAGIALETPCGGQGTCGKCRVRLVNGACEPVQTETTLFSEEEIADGCRLACQSCICDTSVIEIPDSSLLASFYQILSKAKEGHKEEICPSVDKRYVEPALPSMEDDLPDFERIESVVGPFKIDLELARKLPTILRRQGFRGTAVTADNHLIDFEAGNTESECYGAAFDIGTTTLVGTLLDLNTGRESAESSRMNPQISFGDDVLTRIHHASGSADGLRELQEAVANAVNEMIDEMLGEAGVRRSSVYEATFAGNTAMQQILCGIDSSPLGMVPFVPAGGRGQRFPASDLGVRIHDRGLAYVFPTIGGFVGGDTVSGLLASRLMDEETPSLFIDIGTNGEIVLHHNGSLTAASTAAGPAFEGAGISCGMRAAAGAIDKVIFDDRVRFNVLGNVLPVGICGSALVDTAAELLRSGILSETGRFRSPDEIPDSVSPNVRRRLVADNNNTCFVIADETESKSKNRIAVTQRDVRELQLATGAIRAGIRIILRRVGLRPSDLKRVLIAGGFGNFIRRDNAQRIGLIPSEIKHERIVFVGNTSLAGAKIALLSRKARERAEDLARRTGHFNLSADPRFQEEFAEAMLFPE